MYTRKKKAPAKVQEKVVWGPKWRKGTAPKFCCAGLYTTLQGEYFAPPSPAQRWKMSLKKYFENFTNILYVEWEIFSSWRKLTTEQMVAIKFIIFGVYFYDKTEEKTWKFQVDQVLANFGGP